MTKIEQVRNALIRSIQTGEYPAGHRLPSCRQLAEQWGYNKITINKAYQALESEHWVYCVPKGGYYVIEPMDMSMTDREKVDFRTMSADPHLVPHQAFAHAMERVMASERRAVMSYTPIAGLVSLRETLLPILQQQGIYADMEQSIITHGAQQALTMALDMLYTHNSGTLIVECPTYDLVLQYAKWRGIPVRCIQRNKSGYDMEQLEGLMRLPDVKAFYLMPRFHNPTGFALDESTKQHIVELAHRYDVVLLEDDYLGDLCAGTRSLPLHYYDTYEQTIYIRSFSKSFMPGLRLGLAVVPRRWIDDYQQLKFLTDLNTSTMDQASLGIFIRSGMYQRQVAKVQNAYAAKLQHARQLIRSLDLTNTQCHIPSQGIFIWGRINMRVDQEAVDQHLGQRDIWLRWGDDFYPDAMQSHTVSTFRLSLSSVSPQQIHTLAPLLMILDQDT